MGDALCPHSGPNQAARGVYGPAALRPASVAPASAIHAADAIVLRFESPADNRDPASTETVRLVLSGADGDRETVTLTETDADSGIFTSYILTIATPPVAVRDDCRLSVAPGTRVTIDTARGDTGALVGSPALDILIDPYGVTFDSADGAPVAGARVTLIDDATGQPAEVFGDDGVSSFPSSVVTGSTVTDSGGAVYQFPPGDYRFPLARPGRYRLRVEPPAPYSAPSSASPADLAGFERPDGGPYAIVAGSYGAAFTLATPAPVRIDIPLDKPGAPLSLTKTASAAVAEPGDIVQYRITVGNSDANRATGAVTVSDTIPDAMRLRPDTVRFNGARADYGVSGDGRSLSVPIGPLAGGASGLVTYLLEVRPDAQPGDALNRAQAVDSRGSESVIAAASVRIARDALADRMTIIGRVTEGGCAADPRSSKGIAGVRVLLEDGSYAVTDEEGRYHFDGVLPGLHVVQVEPATFPADRAPVDCAGGAEAAGSAISRFVSGSGGMIKRADFRAAAVAPRADAARKAVRAPVASDSEAAGGATDWFAIPGNDIAWLFPAEDHNPRTRAVRIAIRHLPGQKVTLFADGKPVDTLAYEGATTAPDGARAVSLWRGVELAGRTTRFTAQVRDAGGALVRTLSRDVHFAASPMHAELVRKRSLLVADGVTRPVIAVRLTDRDGRPVHHGLVGDFAVPAPYFPAVEADAQAARQLSGLERARPVWRVQGDDGIATIELEPTTASGTLAVSFAFRDGEATRTQRLEAWLDPGDRPWTIVGFAAGTAGFSTLASRSEDLGKGGETWFTDARLALYAKGRVRGKWLMTLAYDSDKDEDETRFQGAIDPEAYYTVYADRSERRHDAASLRRLYLRLERPQFYALFGDYETGLDEAELARYVRSFNGVKAEFNNGRVKATAFAADTPFRHRREELQGNGLSGPYALAARDILPNSETVVIEVRDRLRSDRIVERTTLTRYVDYDIDYIAGLLRFKSPVLSRSSSLDPQFIVIDYEVDGVGERVVNAGGRAAWRLADGKLQVAATAIRDETDSDTTLLGGADIRYRPDAATEIRAEIAVTDRDAKADSGAAEGASTAWLVEAEHHGSKIDLLAYAREQQGGFGVGQTNASETGTRKFGADVRARLTDALSVSARAWQEEYLLTDARRRAGEALVEYRTKSTDLRAGVILADDRLADGREASSTLAQLGATQRLFGNRLELDAQTEFALSDADDSVDFPARHRLSARFAVTPGIGLVGAYEIAEGEAVKARTARLGFDLKPWTGARLVATANRQNIAEYGPRTYAAYGLAQSLPLGRNWTVDLSVDGNRTLSGIEPSRVINPAQPAASGGHLGSDGSIAEDFTALTAGATYRGDRWSWTGRAEVRSGDSGDRWGVTTAALRQIGEGRALGGQASFFHADAPTGATTETARIAISWAHRPAASDWALLDKLELKSDSITGAVIGAPGPIGGAPVLVDGDALSRRVINSLSVNYAPSGGACGEYAIFWGTRYVFDRFGADDVEGWSNLVGADLRFDLSDTVAVGAQGTVRQGAGMRSFAWSAGPSVTLSPMKNSAITVGYNAVGFHDRDFADARYTRSGPFVTLKLKFDQTSLAGLGLR
ncbi:DUF11 domain-containing protein [Sphingomonas gilva]|uniref:DUF11 domain-containing protein n=1 Tax=Sphingomonas gilva TaxID=2305907 RepID=A0A396RJQ1_9SPHN|nr:DUF11 domain-containing protein [Sphingomonas gilva]